MRLREIKAMKIKDLRLALDTKVTDKLTLSLSSKVQEAYTKVFNTENRYRLALVVDEQEKLVGIVGKSDLARAASEETKPDAAIKEKDIILNREYVFVSEDDTVEHASYVLRKNRLGRIVVCNEEKKA